MDIRLSTHLIVQKDGEYLVCLHGIAGERWSNSPYDAKRTRSRERAETWVHEAGGSLRLFNPVIGKTAALKGGATA